MLSPFTVKVLKILPEGVLVEVAKKITNNYLKKFARLHIEGFEKLENMRDHLSLSVIT
jgi:1-acyl-sn-glycerol-3-phosphate acyltransferase